MSFAITPFYKFMILCLRVRAGEDIVKTMAPTRCDHAKLRERGPSCIFTGTA